MAETIVRVWALACLGVAITILVIWFEDWLQDG